MLRAFFGTDLCLKTTNPAVGAAFPDWWTLSGIPNAELGTSLAQMAVDQNGWISAMTNSSNQILPCVLSGRVPVNPNKITIGYRIKMLAVYAGAHSIIHLGSNVSPVDVTSYLFLAGSGGAPWLTGIGTEYYVEHTYDFVANSVQTLVDGVAITPYTPPAVPAAIKTAWLAGNGAINFRLGTSAGGRYAIRDIYILDDVAGDGMVGPLGAQRMFPITLDAADGTGWTPSAGGANIDTLNAALPAAAYVASASDKTPLVTSLKTTAPAGSRVNGVSLVLSGTSAGDAPSISKIEISQGGSNAPVKFVPIQKTAINSAQIGLYPKAPDGTAWDITKIDATALKLTPDTVV